MQPSRTPWYCLHVMLLDFTATALIKIVSFSDLQELTQKEPNEKNIHKNHVDMGSKKIELMGFATGNNFTSLYVFC